MSVTVDLRKLVLVQTRAFQCHWDWLLHHQLILCDDNHAQYIDSFIMYLVIQYTRAATVVEGLIQACQGLHLLTIL